MSVARKELEQRLAHKLTEAGITEAARVAAVVVGCFYQVEDEWDQVEITTHQDDGEVWLHHRFLVARWPVQGVRFERLADRR